MEMEVIDDFAAVRLLINIYMIKTLKMSYKAVNQERFIEDVLKAFRDNSLKYTTKSILFTWKNLLDNYQYYKQNFSDDDARREWRYFDLMNNCFDKSNNVSEKFQDPKWTFSLIKSVTKFKSTVLKQGISLKILQAVQDDLQRMGNYDITLKDIYLQWISLKKYFRQSQRSGVCSKTNKKYIYYEAMKSFFEKAPPHQYTIEQVVDAGSERVSQNELISAIESITPTKESTKVEAKIDVKDCDRTSVKISPAKNTKVTPNENISSNLTPRNTPFTIVMHDILLQCFKRNKTKIRNLNGEVDEETLQSAFEEFEKLGYNVTKQSIRNEWNDLTYRYELIKNTEYPQKWPYFKDMDHVYSSEIMEEDCSIIEVMDESPIIEVPNDDENIVDLNFDNVEPSVEQTLVQTRKIAGNDARITEKLLNVYESNSKEFVEIKDILIERNLLREETNYLLNAFVEKFNKTKQ